MPSEYRLKRRVLFHETDMAGVVHFSCFFKYMEEAEHGLWREAGLAIAPQPATIGFPRVAAALDFKKPLRFEDEFEVWLRIAELTDKTIRYRCVLTRGAEQIADGMLTVIAVRHAGDGSMSAVPLPDHVRAALHAHPDAAN